MLRNGPEILLRATTLFVPRYHCSLPDPGHIQREWGNVLIPRLSGDLHSLSLLLPL